MNACQLRSEERSRLATGLGLAAATVGLILLLGDIWIELVFAGVAVWAAWEWIRLLPTRKAFLATAVVAMSLLFLSLWLTRFFTAGEPAGYFSSLLGVFLYLTIIWWAGMFFLVSAYSAAWHSASWLHWYFRIGVPVVLPGAWVAITGLTPVDLLYLLLLISVSDIAAYYAGRWWGKRKLIPELSPGKSVAGLWGGLVSATLVALAAGSGLKSGTIEVVYFVLASVFTVLVGVIGDLGISMLKRIAGQKDTGTVLPGHGGILDRADSTLAAAPVFFIALPL